MLSPQNRGTANSAMSNWGTILRLLFGWSCQFPILGSSRICSSWFAPKSTNKIMPQLLMCAKPDLPLMWHVCGGDEDGIREIDEWVAVAWEVIEMRSSERRKVSIFAGPRSRRAIRPWRTFRRHGATQQHDSIARELIDLPRSFYPTVEVAEIG